MVLAAMFPRATCAQAPASLPVDADDVVRLRVAWGGGQPTAWQGDLRLSSGQIADHRSLGTKSRAAAVLRSAKAMRVQSLQPIVYEAFDITLRNAMDAELIISLARADTPGSPINITLPVAQLVSEEHNQVLDDEGNRLLIQRSPGDRLQVTLERDHLVFSPGETWNLSVRPNHTGIPPGSSARLTAQVISRAARRSYFKDQFELRVQEDGRLPAADRIEVPIPEAEGVYELILSLDESRASALFRETAHLERTVQFVVVSSRPPELTGSADFRAVFDFDASQPRWWESLTRLPSWNRLPLQLRTKVGDGDARPWNHQGRLVNRLQPGERQAYPLPVSRVGVPHILEVECSADARQALHISIVEPELDSDQHITGVAVEPNPLAGATRDTVRILFWPQTRLPYVMLENADAENSALFETIRLLAGPAHLPAEDRQRSTVGHRQALAYFGEPTYPSLFSAQRAREASSGRELSDWSTFLEGSQRFVEYLRYAGYTGAAVGAIVDGSTVFPAAALDPASRFDTGAYFNNGQDPVQKDALELLFRLFDRERLQLVPIVRLSAAIPQLEQLAANQAEGLRLVDSQGQPYVVGDGFLLYNPLSPQVQAAIASVVRRVVNRYAHHDSFAGICLELGPGTFAQLPGAEWGFDADTVGRFVQDTPELRAEAIDQAMFASLREGPLRERWIAWRAARMTALYQEIASQLTESRSDARLHLGTAKLLDTTALQDVYRPVLRPKKNLDQAMLELGLDFAALSQDGRIRISRPYYDIATAPLLRQAPALELSASEETDHRFGDHGQRTGQTLTRPRQTKWTEPGVESAELADRKSALVNSSVSGGGRRAHLIESLAALDADVLFDGSRSGGTAMPDQVQRQLRVFSHLPAEPFEIVPVASSAAPVGSATGPVVVRQLSRGERTTIYAVNVSPWSTKTTVRLTAEPGTRMRPVCDACLPSQWQPIESGFLWQFEMEPYDVQAIVLSSGQARVIAVTAELPVAVGPMLQSKLAELVVRVGQLKDPIPMLRLADAGFESVTGSAGIAKTTFDAWESSAVEGGSVQPDSTVRRSGKTSMRISSTGPITWARSTKFAAPKTGRLAVHVWVRREANQPLPPLRLAIEGRLGDQPYYRYANITDVEESASPVAEWRPFVLHVDDLPSLDLEYVQVRFDLMGQGTVWLDDVTVYGMSFTRNEHYELSRLIAAADLQLREGRVADCAKTLQRFWPRLLIEQFPSEPRVAATDDGLEPISEEDSASPLEKIRQLVPRIRRFN